MTFATRTLAFAGLALLLLAPASQAQDLEAKRDKKLKEAWFTSNPWTNDYDKAREEAKKSGKVIFAYFTRTYAY